MSLQKYQSQMIENQPDRLVYEYTQIDGKEDWGLLETTFEEFIRHPILLSLERGRPIIKTAKSAILNNLVNVEIRKEREDNRIIFILSGSILKNRLISAEELNGDVEFLQVGDDSYLLLENITANRVGTILAIWYVVDWLNGMPITVNYEDYNTTCANCVMNTENLYKYYKLYDIQVRTYIEQNEGCVGKRKEFEKGDGCNKFFIRNTYPDLGEVAEIIKDLI